MDLQELGLTAVRAVVIYVYLFVSARLWEKRTVGNFTAFAELAAAAGQ
ncbi:MAG TPA: hypothetical protein VJG32_10250 [Anaerolineae bacterium]|nr:hypothetical protein [Anaerolineae bacterium]